MTALDRFFALGRLQWDETGAPQRLWRFCRMTAWRTVKLVMKLAGIAGPHACPKGLRHGFGVGALQSGVPVTLVQRWMGHARLSTTSIYLDVSGPDEIAFAALFWGLDHRTEYAPSARTDHHAASARVGGGAGAAFWNVSGFPRAQAVRTDAG